MLVCVYVVKTEASIDFDGFLSIFDKDMEKECLCVCVCVYAYWMNGILGI